MIILTCDKISKSFGIDIILNQITFSVNDGTCMGIIGGNGAGKSTLFKILAGLLPQDDGDIYMAAHTTLGYLPQNDTLQSDKNIWDELLQVFSPVLSLEDEMRQMEHAMAHCVSMDTNEYSELLKKYSKIQETFEEQGGYSYESYIRGVLIGLGFSQEEFYMPIAHLSGGQKTRVSLAKVLLRKPNLLLLDEPTNHLDLSAMQWLEGYLSTYPGTIMIISHDRYFLDTLCDNILEIENTNSTVYSGNYTDYQKQKAQSLAQQEKEYTLQQKEIRRQEAIIERYRSFNREKSIKAAKRRQKTLDRMEKVDKVQYSKDISFSFDVNRQSGRDVLSVDSLGKTFDKEPLFKDVAFDIRIGDRVAIIGPNGCGKSTLLKIILGKLSPTSGTIKIGTGVETGYYDQELTSLNGENTVIEELWSSFPKMTETEIRNALAARLFKGDDVYKKVSSLSGGEKGHLILTKLVLSNKNFLLLDEPTNHLDMTSREKLEQALADYPGTILAISHDRYFLNRIANRIFKMESGNITQYMGNYDDYLEKVRLLESLAVQEIEDNNPRTTQLKKNRRQERLEREKIRANKERLAILEQQIHEAEEEIGVLEERMSDPDLYDNVDEMLKVQQKYTSLKERLDKLYFEWDSLYSL
ncbi:MAG: ABC-F family ATP-binding cassette domain-containing protein [Clostridiales bacterium]|nr:ABC-F family ATP-binding cassette domain-containing protein [Clostridiales bacterium]